jgi:hypothetical protein
MATPNEIPVRILSGNFLLRTCVYLLGFGAITWGGFVLPLFSREAPLNRVTAEVLEGHAFKTQALLSEARKADTDEPSSFCNPVQSRDAVILRLALLDDAIRAANHTLIDSAYAPLYDVTRRALACVPTDSFTWLTLFWLDAGKRGLAPENVNYLRLSYALGPNEGWIALWRSKLAFAVFAQLPADLADDAVDDVIKLVDSAQLIQQAAAIFASASPAAQSRVVAHLQTAKANTRQWFANTLRDRGLDVVIPNVAAPQAPPWRKGGLNVRIPNVETPDARP